MEEYKFNSDYNSIESSEKPQANRIAQWAKTVLNPNKVIDAGCGPGTYVYSMRDLGINAFGYDLDKRVHGKPYLTNQSLFDINDSGDVVMCLEVAEHIVPDDSQEVVDKLFDILEKDGVLIFTAARLGQGGTDHINCRPKEYWEHKFKEKGLIRSNTLEHELIQWVSQDIHMGWFTANLMIFYKIDDSTKGSTSGSLIGPPQN